MARRTALYPNSYDLQAGVYPAGLGAWHPFLGFNPYGPAETCLTGNAPVGKAESPNTGFVADYCVTDCLVVTGSSYTRERIAFDCQSG